jgi:hypothetical protein
MADEPGVRVEMVVTDASGLTDSVRVEVLGGVVEVHPGGRVVVQVSAVSEAATAAALAAGASIEGHVEIQAVGEVSGVGAATGAPVTVIAFSTGHMLPVKDALDALILGEAVRHLVEVAEDPSRVNFVNVAAGTLIAVLLMVLANAAKGPK